MSEPEDTFDILARELRNTEPVVGDRGFSQAVMMQLPRAWQLPGWVRNLAVLSAAAGGSAVSAWLVLGSLETLAAGMIEGSAMIVGAAAMTYLVAGVMLWTEVDR